MNRLPRRSTQPLSALLVATAVLAGCSTRAESGWGMPRQQDGNTRASLYILSAEQIRNSNASSVEDLLEQHFSGFYHRPSDFRPGASGEVFVLGNAGPLFVIDGVPIDYAGYLGLNPHDVESIEFVKHGAAAMYGMRGSAGAILIRTKHD